MAEYPTYVTYGHNTPLWKIITDMHQHVDEANAKRIAEEAFAIPVPDPVPTGIDRRLERSWVIAKHVWQEAKKLRDQEGA